METYLALRMEIRIARRLDLLEVSETHATCEGCVLEISCPISILHFGQCWRRRYSVARRGRFQLDVASYVIDLQSCTAVSYSTVHGLFLLVSGTCRESLGL